jgi:hypothetical protein
VAFPPAPLPPADPTLAPPAAVESAEGRWRLQVEAVDDVGEASTATQAFTLNNTLSALRSTPRTLVVRSGGKARLRAGVTLTRTAAVLVTIETKAGVTVAQPLRRRAAAGRLLFSWDGRTFGGRRLAYGGSYVLRVRATNDLGRVELTQGFGVLRAAPAKKKKPAAPRG